MKDEQIFTDLPVTVRAFVENIFVCCDCGLAHKFEIIRISKKINPR